MRKDFIGNVIIEKGLEGFNRYYSVYRARVVDNRDPDKANRLLVWVPDIMGGITVWAYPRNQYGSWGHGFKPFTPKIDEVVYVSFEYGDAGKALWEAHSWGAGETPPPLDHPAVGGIVTPNHNMIYYDERTNALYVNFKGTINIYGAKGVNVLSKEPIVVSSNKGVVLNGGDNGGLVNIEQLTAKLNNLVKELEQVKLQINTHTHNCTAPGTPSGPPTNPITQTITQFDSSDYEDDKALH